MYLMYLLTTLIFITLLLTFAATDRIDYYDCYWFINIYSYSGYEICVYSCLPAFRNNKQNQQTKSSFYERVIPDLWSISNFIQH